jgi:Mg2+/Co2+ transporter CorB
LLRRFKQEPDRPIAAILVLNTIANSGGAAIATEQFGARVPGRQPGLVRGAFVVTVLTFTEIVPKTIGVVHANASGVPVVRTWCTWMILVLGSRAVR